MPANPISGAAMPGAAPQPLSVTSHGPPAGPMTVTLAAVVRSSKASRTSLAEASAGKGTVFSGLTEGLLLSTPNWN